MAAAELDNRRKAAFFVYREDIRSTETLRNGRVRRDTTSTYEVSILEGEPYHRRIAFAGRPLSPEDAAEEEKRYREVERFRRNTPMEERRRRYFGAEENRFRIDSAIVLEHHDARLIGEDTVAGRPGWVIETRPRKGAPKPKRRSQWALALRIKYWIDQQSFFPVRIAAEQLYDFDSSRKGAITEFSTRLEDGVWLRREITIQGRAKLDGQTVDYRTEQVYSSYRRFAASSVLWFDHKD